MKSKLNNLLSQEDFKANWKSEQAKKTKRTETGLDILNEGIEDEIVGDRYPLSDEPIGDLSTGRVEDGPGVEEIIPEGLPEDDFSEVDVDHIIDELTDLDDDIIEEVVNYLREVLLELEQNGEIEDNFTDNIDDQYEGDWPGWIEEVIQLPELAEDAIKGVSDIIFGGSREDRVGDEDDEFGELPKDEPEDFYPEAEDED